MSLSCECDYKGPELYDSRRIRARKAHECCECGRLIPVGETYERVDGKWNGDFSVFKTCEPCADLRESMESLGFCMSFDNLREEHREYIEYYEPPALKSNFRSSDTT